MNETTNFQSPAKTEEESVVEEELDEENDLQDTSTDEKLGALLRRKMELETIQNELKHLRDQQKLLSEMEKEVIICSIILAISSVVIKYTREFIINFFIVTEDNSVIQNVRLTNYWKNVQNCWSY